MTGEPIRRRRFISSAAVLAGSGFSFGDCATDSGTIPFRTDIPITGSYDVVVCGGGPSGLASAVSAREAGAKTLLVEGQGQLGGMGTSGLVSHWLGGRTSDCTQWVVGGLFRSFSREAEKQGIALIPIPDESKKYQPHGWHKGQLSAGIPFDPYGMAGFLDREAAEAGIDVLLLTQAVDVRVENNRITHVIIFNKSGLSAISAGTVVDATGDADIASRSGCATVTGRESDGLTAPSTLQFHVDNVDQDTLSDYIHTHGSPRFREKIKELRAAGEWPFPYDIFISVQLSEKDTMMINTSRLVGFDGTNGASVTQGMIEGRREIRLLLDLMRRHFPGFAHARLKAVAPLLGVRESRRIIADYTLTVSDLVEGREFDDTVGFSSYGWDLPDPKKPSLQPMSEKKLKRRRPVTPIPYRIMIPSPVTNLICPGRAVSVERDVLGPLRVMAPCMAMGEAAGLAAASVDGNKSFRDIDIQALREKLKRRDAIIEWI